MPQHNANESGEGGHNLNDRKQRMFDLAKSRSFYADEGGVSIECERKPECCMFVFKCCYEKGV